MTEELTDEAAPSAIVVIDTNVWRATKLLRSPIAASLLFMLEHTGIPLGFPEVVEREVLKHGVAIGVEAREKIASSLESIRAILGSAPDVSLPTDEELKEAVGERIDSLTKYLRSVPFEIDVASRGLNRVNAKHPPSHTGQQYKDAVIWEQVMDLAREFDVVHFVSADKAFFQDRSYRRGLESRLVDELSDAGLSVRLHATLGSCLEAITPEAAAFDSESVSGAIAHEVVPRLRQSVEDSGLVLQDRRQARLQAFVTEDPQRLAVTFALVYEVEPGDDGTHGAGGIAMVTGQCTFHVGTESAIDVQLARIQIEQPHGEPGQQHVFLRGASVLGGRRQVPFEVREPLPGGGEFVHVRSSDAGVGTDTGEAHLSGPPAD